MACTHLAALMQRRRHFASTAEAVAWTLIARPRLSQSVDLCQLEAQLAAAPAGRQARARSLSVCVSLSTEGLADGAPRLMMTGTST